MTARAEGSTTLYEGGGFVLGEYHLSPGAPEWSDVNVIGPGHLIAFPATAVEIRHRGRAPIVTDQTVAVLYEPFQEYTRNLVSPDGDHCRFVALTDARLAEIAGVDHVRFGAPSSPSPARAYLLARLAVRAARRGSDRLLIEEAIARAVGGVLRTGFTTFASLRAVEEVKALLATRYAEDLSLAEIGAHVHVSPYHLARRFRAQTGSSIHAYRDQVRLRTALEMLEAGVHLADVAAACGYASHAHFTGRFRRAFGVTPSTARAAGLDTREMRTFVEASSALAP